MHARRPGCFDDDDDDLVTIYRNRDGTDINRSPNARETRANAARGSSPASSSDAPKASLPPRLAAFPSMLSAIPIHSLPLGFWVFAAMVAGLVSFHVAPQLRASLEPAAPARASR